MISELVAIALAANQYLFLTATEARFTQPGVTLKWTGANPNAAASTFDEQPGKVNYFTGHDSTTGIRTYGKVRFAGVYPGIDLVYYGNSRALEYDIVIAPGSDPERVSFTTVGAQRATIDSQGDLLLYAGGGPVRFHKPVIYQTRGQEIAGGYVLRANGSVGFKIGAYDKRRPLIIDPTIAYSTYLTGDAGSSGSGVAVDSAGNSYVAGLTASSGFPTVAALQTAQGGVSKSTSGGAAWTLATGGFNPNAQAVAVDPVTPSNLYAATFGGVLKSVNSGVTWTAMTNGLTSIYVQAVAVDPNTPSTIYAGTHLFSGIAGGVFKSIDSGATWTSVGLATSDIQSISVSAATPPSIYASALDGLYVSMNGGATWTEPITGGAIREVGLDPSQPMVAYAVGGGGVINGAPFESTADGGAHWHIPGSSGGPGGLALSRGAFAVAVDPSNPSRVLAGGSLDNTGSGAIYVSTDMGASWKVTTASNCFYRALVFNPVTPSVVYAGCQNGVYESLDGGTTWAFAGKGVNSFNVYSLAVDPKTPSNVYAGSRITSGSAFVSKFGPTGSLIYSTYLAGGAFDQASAIAVDAAGNAYVTGRTTSSNFPTTSGAFQTTLGGGAPVGPYDAFVTKLNPTGSALVYSTFLGGSADDLGNGIAVDGAGNAIVTGIAVSTNFPLANAIQSSFTGLSSPFVTKLNASGSALVYSTYLGAGGVGVAVDVAGNAYVTGAGNPAAFPSTAGSLSVGSCGIVKLSSGGSITYAAYAGGLCNAIAVDSSGSAYVTGNGGATLTTTPGAFQTAPLPGGSSFHAFVSKLNPAGTAFVFSTYLAGSSQDQGWAIAVDAAGNSYVTGSTNSLDFPLVNPIAISIRGKLNDAFIAKLSPAGNALIYSTYTGSSGNPIGYGIAADSSGNAYITGVDGGTDFPVTANAIPTNGAAGGAFVMKLAASPDATPTLHPAIAAGGTPVANPAAVVDSASYNRVPVAAGSLVSVFGSDLGYPNGGAGSIPLPRALNGTSVTINGTPAPLLFVSPSQVNFQLPWEAVNVSPSSIVVTAGSIASATKQIAVSAYDPGIFTIGSYGAVLIAGTGGSVAAPLGTFPGSRPVKRGEYVEIYCTGLGPVNPPVATGASAAASPVSMTPVMPTVAFGGVSGTVTFSGLAPGLVGLYQVDVLVPANAPTGYVYILMGIGGVTSVQVAIQIQ